MNTQPPEDLLQASRRVDWRFLLPSPDLGRVAYLAPTDPSLTASLQRFATTFTVLERAQTSSRLQRQAGDGAAAWYDLVVASNPAYQDLRFVTSLLDKGASLYIEVNGIGERILAGKFTALQRVAQRPLLGFPNHYRRALKELGLSTIDIYWFWPNFQAATKIIPYPDRNALMQSFALQHKPDGMKKQVGRGLTRLFLTSRWLDYVIPAFGIVAS